MKTKLLRSVFSVLLGLAMLPASATVVSITVSGPTGCDPLSIRSVPLGDELGFSYTFPVGEQISFSSVNTSLSACSSTDNLSMINKLVSITNLTTYALPEVFFVASGGSTPGTFTNFDGYVNGVQSMKIDRLGLNTSLYAESMTLDGIFEPNETWQFIVQDYTSPTAVDAFYSPSLVGGADTLPSIIVPEPTSVGLGLLGGLLLLRRRR